VLAGAYVSNLPDWEQDIPSGYKYTYLFFFETDAAQEVPVYFRFRRLGLTANFLINGTHDILQLIILWSIFAIVRYYYKRHKNAI
jgi:hypothetical protein